MKLSVRIFLLIIIVPLYLLSLLLTPIVWLHGKIEEFVVELYEGAR